MASFKSIVFSEEQKSALHQHAEGIKDRALVYLAVVQSFKNSYFEEKYGVIKLEGRLLNIEDRIDKMLSITDVLGIVKVICDSVAVFKDTMTLVLTHMKFCTSIGINVPPDDSRKDAEELRNHMSDTHSLFKRLLPFLSFKGLRPAP